jgi:hypothetical protein
MSDSIDVSLAYDVEYGDASLLLDDELHLTVADVDDGGARHGPGVEHDRVLLGRRISATYRLGHLGRFEQTDRPAVQTDRRDGVVGTDGRVTLTAHTSSNDHLVANGRRWIAPHRWMALQAHELSSNEIGRPRHSLSPSPETVSVKQRTTQSAVAMDVTAVE